MSKLQTVRLKPNPSGKDRTRHSGATAVQLGGEWEDIENVCSQPIDLTGVSLHHIAYSADGRTSRWEQVMGFKGTLQPGKVIRVHAGHGPETLLRDEDRIGADYHLFSGGNCVWNNDRGDCAGLFVGGQPNPFDKACYQQRPPEGTVLNRVGDGLVASGASAFAGSRR